MANEIGIRGEAKEESGYIIVQNDKYQLDAELSSGVVNYKNNSEQSGYDEATIEKNLPSDEEARKIADSFLATRNLRPENAVFYDITHNKGFLTGDPPSKCWESINVDYSHEMNGYSLLTDQFRVEIGVHGTVLSIFEKWTGYTPFKEYPLITPDEAIMNLKKSGIVIPSGMKDPQKATVTSIKIGYIGETQTKTLPYLIPCTNLREWYRVLTGHQLHSINGFRQHRNWQRKSREIVEIWQINHLFWIILLSLRCCNCWSCVLYRIEHLWKQHHKRNRECI